MLVLTRKLQEQIRIGDNVTITILRVKGQSVRVGIDAPRQVRVVRGELPTLTDKEPGERNEDGAAARADANTRRSRTAVPLTRSSEADAPDKSHRPMAQEKREPPLASLLRPRQSSVLRPC